MRRWRSLGMHNVAPNCISVGGRSYYGNATVTVAINCTCASLLPGGETGLGAPAAHDDAGGPLQEPTSSSPVTSIVHAAHGTAFTRAFGCVMRTTYLRERPVTHYTFLFCNGDLLDYDLKTQGGDTFASVRMVLSPHCPDPRFRSVEIKADIWRHHAVENPGGIPSTLLYPDPIQSPDMFRIYHEYFKTGFLLVRECQRAAVAAILAREAL